MLAEYLDAIFYLLGKAIVVAALLIIMASILGAVSILYSFKTGHFFAARLMLISVSLLESVIKAIFLLAKADDSIVDDVGVRLRNYINRKKFLGIPKDERFIFLPQCLRSIDCPAKLTPEGIDCVGCGRCNVIKAKKIAEGMGYRFFVVSGSSFIKRIIKAHKPKAIIGVGCQLEIKDGLDLCHSHDIPAIGVPLSRGGCVSTILEWDKLYDVMSDRI
jgi:hypothetical protein